MSVSVTNPPASIHFHDGSREIVLRQAKLDHVEVLVEAIEESLDALRQFMPWAHSPQTIEVQTERLTKLVQGQGDNQENVYHFFDGVDGPFLGCLGIHSARMLNPAGLEIGYWCRSGRAGEGWTTLACQCIVVLGLDYFGSERIQCVYNEANLGSGHVVRKVGFREEARLRNYEHQPSENQRAAGALGGPYAVMNALFPEDRTGLDWYPGVASRLKVFSAAGQRAEPQF
jgi:RimJ/RimL family protein N-acetyltransferase